MVRGARSDSRGRHYREIRNTLPDVCGSIPAGGSDEPETRGGSGSGARRDRSRGSHRFAGTVRLRREGGWVVMSEKVSTITLRLTAEEAAQLEILKDIIGKKSGSEAIKYVVKEYPRFCTHYKQEAKEHGELKRKYREQGEAVRGFLSALDKLEKAGMEKE
nr:hypothetical protein [Bacteroides finegoldii]